jgi:hypothetical protein
MIFEATYLYR